MGLVLTALSERVRCAAEGTELCRATRHWRAGRGEPSPFALEQVSLQAATFRQSVLKGD
jgi:hypothetical protein